MRILALDLSTSTGWAVFEDGQLVTSGVLDKVHAEDFNVNDDPNKSPKYPWNIRTAAEAVADLIAALLDVTTVNLLVIENTVKGRNRHTQRQLEWIHLKVLDMLLARRVTAFRYMDPSEWRKIVDLRLSKDDKKNNRDVSAGKKRGRVTRKHLSVRMANEIFGLQLKIKDNDRADAILLGYAASKLAA